MENDIKTNDEKYSMEKNKYNLDLFSKNKKINELQKEFENLNQKNIQLKKDLEQKALKFDGAINQFEEMNNKLKNKEEKIKEYEMKIKYYQNIKIQYDNISKINENERPKEEILKTPAEEFYDAIVDINSIKSLKSLGWKIAYNKERKERYQQMISEETIKMRVLGLNNVGKTFILFKIANAELPSGYSLETKGISIKYS